MASLLQFRTGRSCTTFQSILDSSGLKAKIENFNLTFNVDSFDVLGEDEGFGFVSYSGDDTTGSLLVDAAGGPDKWIFCVDESQLGDLTTG